MDMSVYTVEHSTPSTIPVFEEEHLSSQGCDSVQHQVGITGIRSGGGLRFIYRGILVRVGT